MSHNFEREFTFMKLVELVFFIPVLSSRPLLKHDLPLRTARHPKEPQVRLKAVPKHTYGGAGGRGSIAPTHSRPRH
jgi:hypothetical protein